MQNEFQTNFNSVDKIRDRQYECNKTENILKESTVMNLTYQVNTCLQHYVIPDLQNNSVFNRNPLQKRFPPLSHQIDIQYILLPRITREKQPQNRLRNELAVV